MNEHSDGVLLEVIIEFLRCCWMNILNGGENNLISSLERKVTHPPNSLFPIAFLYPPPKLNPEKYIFHLEGAAATPLHLAAMGGHAGVAHLLALHGANPSLLTAKKETPLQIACAKG